MNNIQPRILWMTVSAVGLAVVLLLVLLQRRLVEPPAGPAATAPPAAQAALPQMPEVAPADSGALLVAHVAPEAPANAARPDVAPTTLLNDSPSTLTGLVPDDRAAELAQSIETPAMDPEQQPRSYYTQELIGLDKAPMGFTATGVQFTENGVVLAPPATGAEDQPRRGMLESSAEAFEFAANGMVPMFKQTEPDGTRIEMEISLSADGSTWGDWYPVQYDRDDLDEVAATYPDGRPNPNHGYTPTILMFGDLRLFNYFRYRVSLQSSSAESPTFSAFRLYYMDSTLGRGELANPSQSPQGN